MSETTPSPVSDGSSSSEGTVLRDFVDQAIAEKRLPTLSPRAAILSQSSLQSPAVEEKEKSPAIRSGAVDPARQVRKRSNGSRRTLAREVAKGSALSQLVDVDLTRKDPKDEVMRLRDILKTVERHSASEARRVKELERANLAAERRAQQLMETQLKEKQEALKAQQEVRLVNLQLRNAQEELERKQQEVKRIEQQRDEAEAEAERANEKARKFREQTIAAAAREEGRRMGFKAGLDFATRERQMIAAKKASMQATRPRAKISSGDRRGASHADKGQRKAVKYRPQPAYMPPPAEVPPPTMPVSYSMPQVEDLQIAPPPPTDPHPLEAPFDMQPPDNALSPSPPQNYDTIIEPVVAGKPLVNPKGPYTRMIQPHEDGTFWAYTTPLPPKKAPEFSRPPNDPSEKPIEHLPPNDPPQARTPPISIFQLDIPSAEELNRQYSYSQENSNDAIHQGPRDQWLTASSYHERRGQGRPPPKVDAPLQPLPLNPPRPKPSPQQPGPKVKFPNILSRPSLLKTKAQNSSWYRTLSWRKKNKQVIDPIPEQNVPTSADPNSASTYDSQPTATDPRYTSGPQYVHEQPVIPSEGWYQPPPLSQPPVIPGAVPSMRSAYSRRRPSDAVSAVSTRVSEFDLLATPHPAAMSMRSGKESRKGKDNFMSPIKENPASRGNSPSANEERAAQASQENMRSMASVLWQPGMEHRPVQQEPSYATFNSQNKRKSRRPPTISVPDYDQELEPFGVAYNRDAATNGYPSYSAGDLNRRPTRVSEKTTPGTAIGIDVVPPSGFAPDGVQSPPHTGQNHLSPYHSYHAAAPLFKQSVTSLRRPGSTRPPSAAAMSSRKQSQQSFGAYADPPPGAWGSSVPSVVNTAPPRPPSSAAQPSSRMSRPATASQRGTPQPPTYAPFSGLGPTEDYAQSVRSRRTPSANPNPFASASQVSLSNLTGTGGVLGQPRNASATRLVLASPLHRVTSNASMRSQDTRYSRFDPSGYVDPALWVDGEPPAPPSVPPAGRHEQMDYLDPGAPQRVATASPGLSYMSNPYEK